VWYHAESSPPWDIPVIQEIESCQWTFHGKNEFFVNSHIQDIPENGADVGKFNLNLIEIHFNL
jgi:cholesterol 7-desaturase